MDIRFRAWEKNLKQMIPVNNIDFVKQMINTDSAWRMFSEIELMRYTVLQDKTGKPIYESDIVRWDDRSMGKYWRIGAMEYKYGHYQVFDINTNQTFHFGAFAYEMTTDKNLEIIGNIYENPELLLQEVTNET